MEEIKKAWKFTIEDYKAIALQVSNERGKSITWKFLQVYLSGKECSMKAETEGLIKKETLKYLETKCLNILDIVKAYGI